jgi:hypothetical protein
MTRDSVELMIASSPRSMPVLEALHQTAHMEGESIAAVRNTFLRFFGSCPFIEVEQRFTIEFFIEQGTKGVEIIDRPNKPYHGDALQRTQVYSWIREVKSSPSAFDQI